MSSLATAYNHGIGPFQTKVSNSVAAQLPFELQKLPPQALDVLRFFISNDNDPSDDLDIMEGADLSERSFSKAIKRLVTKKFAEMDSMRRYTLTDKGVDLMQELAKYDESTGTRSEPKTPAPEPTPAEPVQRRLTLVLAEPLVAGKETQIYLGIDEGLDDHEVEMLLRLSVVNADPDQQEEILSLESTAAHTTFQVVAGDFKEVRLRAEAFQADEFSGDLHAAGGMYVDVDVIESDEDDEQLVAYGTDVKVLPM